MTEESLSHSTWDCTYHIVWIPKYRRKVLFGKYRAEIVEILKTLLANKGIQIVEGACCRDHVHLSIRIPPKYSVSEVMGYLKGKSALMIYDRHPEWRRLIGKDRTFWARGYYVSTVGLNEDVIRKYIQGQEDSERISDAIVKDGDK